MVIFEGLQGYEQLLLVLGVGLFSAASFITLYSVIKDRKYIRIVPLYVISIIMIGFPGIERIELEKDKLSIQKKVLSIAGGPLGEKEISELKRVIARVVERPNLAAETMLQVTFFQSMLSPEQFDNFVSINRNRYTNDFFSCLELVKNNLRIQLTEYYRNCENLTEPNARSFCITNNEYAKSHDYLKSIEKVLRGKMSWAQTIHGTVASMVKKELGEEYTKIVKQYFTKGVLDEMLSCS